MESYYAHIKNDVVVTVEVVTDEFVKANPQRYKGKWLKVGGNSKRPFCGKGYIYLPEKDKIIVSNPYPSWSLNNKDIWEAPKVKPIGDYTWNETTLSWFPTEII